MAARLAIVCGAALFAMGCGGGEGASPVGELVVSRVDETGDVYAIALESGEERLIGPGAEYAGSWSASGRKVATYGPEGDGTLVTTVDTGAGRRFRATCPERVWAPDETILACAESEPWFIATLDLETGEKRALTDPSELSVSPAWSPDSRSIAYLVYGALMTMGRDGSGKRAIAAGADAKPGFKPVWSPDGRRIAYLRDRDVWTVGAEGGDSRLLFDSGGRNTHSLAWSPDGRYIALMHADDDPEIFAVDVATGEARNLTDNEKIGDRDPVWSPDSRHVAYLTDADDGGLMVVSVDGGSPRRVSDYAYVQHWFPAPDSG